MMFSSNDLRGGSGVVLQGDEQSQLQQQQHEEATSTTIVRRPQTVSSLSSLETTGYDLNDACQGLDSNNISHKLNQQVTIPSIASLMESVESRSSSNTLVTTATTISSGVSEQGSGNSNLYLGENTNSTQEHHQLQRPSSIALSVQSGTVSMQISPSTGVVVASATNTTNTNTVPEFLYQLTKMLTDNNRDIIEWSNSKIEVHSPHKLETHVLNRYFRHSKFASFQRQLNYFGFRKLAGKGKMAPCSYVNDATTDELGSLLLIKRKHGNESKSKMGGKKRDRNGKQEKSNTAPNSGKRNNISANDAVNPVLAGILYRSSNDNTPTTTNNDTLRQSQKEIARVAVGKGVRHGFVPQQQHQNNMLKNIDSSSTAVAVAAATSNGNSAQVSTRPVAPSPVQASLNALTQNFNESLQGSKESANEIDRKVVSVTTSSCHQGVNQYDIPPSEASTATMGNVEYVPGSLRRDDSLVDLAMIPVIGDGQTTESNVATSTGFSFVDFPFDSSFFIFSFLSS